MAVWRDISRFHRIGVFLRENSGFRIRPPKWQRHSCLSALSGQRPECLTTQLRAINDAGYAVGTYVSAGVTTAFYTHPRGYKANLPTAKVGTNYRPIAINQDSDVIGTSSLKGVVYNLLSNTAVLVTSRVPPMLTLDVINDLGDVARVNEGNTAYIMPKPPGAPVFPLGLARRRRSDKSLRPKR